MVSEQSPGHLLDILKSGSGDATINIKSTTGGDPTIIFNSAAANRSGLLKFQDNGTNVGRIEYVHNGDRIDFQAGSATGATMSMENGKVGIGTTSPTEKLEVAGTALVENAKLKAIAKDISDTAVDVFVYDTRKDSDGGAWRKRTQHTSWYNEALNTATRGARKEFPSVAVIVAETRKVTIYDADDPDMPMWMVFNAIGGLTGGDMLPADDLTSTTALNAVLCYGMASSGSRNGLGRIDLIKETRIHAKGSNVYYYLGNIAERSDNKSNSQIQGGPDSIVGTDVNDVAMTVLPNAPIDADTGLPVPTIAVATDGGVSVIKDNGTVVDITGTSQGSDAPVDAISFVGNHSILFSHRYASEISTIPTVDTSATYYNGLSTFTGRITNSISHDDDVHVSALSSDDNIESIALNEEDAASKSVSGLSLANHYRVVSDPDRASCFITSDYNTGWMNGDIKLATLSDTDTTNAVGTDLVTNGTFASNTTGWLGSSGATLSLVSNTMEVTGVGYGSQAITTVVGKVYVVAYDYIRVGGINGKLYIATTNSGGDVVATSALSSSGSYATTFTAVSTTTYLNFRTDSSGDTRWDNISCCLAEEDRSVNGNGQWSPSVWHST